MKMRNNKSDHKNGGLTLKHLNVSKIPRLGKEAEHFEKDLKEIIKKQPLMPEES
ncbi:MAG: hypothetical protein Q7T83_08270 [Thermodesulfovibrionales bacterium]|nr:hypothetical protein [Thermodesulfovibrionales bacterium]